MIFIYNAIIEPIVLIVQLVYVLMSRLFREPGIAIIFVSLAVSFLTLPLYRRSDALQEEERAKEQEMSGWVSHIKKTFHGDKRFMILSTYYRQQGYRPIYAVRGSLSLLLQIPFFIAAYQYLSALEELKGQPFLWIRDLSAPDAFFCVGNIPINLLPIIMTLVNIVSGMIYTRGYPLKTKVQLYSLAAFFLIFLYNSPSGLVLYWTMNNIFSLLKNVFSRVVRLTKTQADVCIAAGGVVFAGVLWFFGLVDSGLKAAFSILCVLGAFLPLICSLRKGRGEKAPEIPSEPQKKTDLLFLLGALVLAALTGLLIPSSIVSSSPAEFIDLRDYHHPLRFVLSTFAISFGFFVLWGSLFYYLCEASVKKAASRWIFAAAGIAFMDYMLFGKNLGLLSPYMKTENAPGNDLKEAVINLAALLLATVLFMILRVKRSQWISWIYTVVLISIAGMSFYNIARTVRIVASMDYVKNRRAVLEEETVIHLSKKGKNVVVIMLDRAINGYVPYIFEEKPELTRQFAGFTYYPNTTSFGKTTNYGTPALFGGYEYTPARIDERAEESLEVKQNEAIRVMPALFNDGSFDVAVCDPPYAGYHWISDLSIYDDYQNVRAYSLEGNYDALPGTRQKDQKELFFKYSIMKISPVFLQGHIYDDACYFSDAKKELQDERFMKAYKILNNLPYFTEVFDDDRNTFMMMTNNTTHEPTILQLPGYVPEENVDNSRFKDTDVRHAEGYPDLPLDTQKRESHYHVNMAAMICLGKWFDYLREQGVYDNTRIILVADHGDALNQFDKMIMDDGLDVEALNPLFMIKDFDERELKTDNSFMTTADVAATAFKGLIRDPVNPFTGKRIDQSLKQGEQLIPMSTRWDIEKNNGNTFDSSDAPWYTVHDDIFKNENWKKVRD